MNLRITLTALSVVLRFTVPENSSFWLVSTQDHLTYRVECCKPVGIDTNVVATLPRADACRFFQVFWTEPGKGTTP